jgi:hypothetical protein
MSAKADGCPNTIFTDTQRDQLAKLLYNASPQETRDETLQRLEQLTTTFPRWPRESLCTLLLVG